MLGKGKMLPASQKAMCIRDTHHKLLPLFKTLIYNRDLSDREGDFHFPLRFVTQGKMDPNPKVISTVSKPQAAAASVQGEAAAAMLCC